MPTKKKKLRYEPGMVYAVPLKDSTFGIAQASVCQGDFIHVIYVALFSNRFKKVPEIVPALTRKDAISLTATWRQTLNNGDWHAIGLEKELFKKKEYPNEKYARKQYVGAVNYDAGILEEFISAYHGIIPWNTYFDENYLDQFLYKKVKRPETAIVLEKNERLKYRKEVLKIDTYY